MTTAAAAAAVTTTTNTLRDDCHSHSHCSDCRRVHDRGPRAQDGGSGINLHHAGVRALTLRFSAWAAISRSAPHMAQAVTIETVLLASPIHPHNYTTLHMSKYGNQDLQFRGEGLSIRTSRPGPVTRVHCKLLAAPWDLLLALHRSSFDSGPCARSLGAAICLHSHLRVSNW